MTTYYIVRFNFIILVYFWCNHNSVWCNLNNNEDLTEKYYEPEKYESDHEFPKEIPTKVKLRGNLATPASDSGIALNFTPRQTYVQVRRIDSKYHLPQSAAVEEASNVEEVINAPRLREVVSHKKTQQVYEEQGYEDSGYDHGGRKVKGELNEMKDEVKGMDTLKDEVIGKLENIDRHEPDIESEEQAHNQVSDFESNSSQNVNVKYEENENRRKLIKKTKGEKEEGHENSLRLTRKEEGQYVKPTTYKPPIHHILSSKISKTGLHSTSPTYLSDYYEQPRPFQRHKYQPFYPTPYTRPQSTKTPSKPTEYPFTFSYNPAETRHNPDYASHESKSHRPRRKRPRDFPYEIQEVINEPFYPTTKRYVTGGFPYQIQNRLPKNPPSAKYLEQNIPTESYQKSTMKPIVVKPSKSFKNPKNNLGFNKGTKKYKSEYTSRKPKIRATTSPQGGVVESYTKKSIDSVGHYSMEDPMFHSSGNTIDSPWIPIIPSQYPTVSTEAITPKPYRPDRKKKPKGEPKKKKQSKPVISTVYSVRHVTPKNDDIKTTFYNYDYPEETQMKSTSANVFPSIEILEKGRDVSVFGMRNVKSDSSESIESHSSNNHPVYHGINSTKLNYYIPGKESRISGNPVENIENFLLNSRHPSLPKDTTKEWSGNGTNGTQFKNIGEIILGSTNLTKPKEVNRNIDLEVKAGYSIDGKSFVGTWPGSDEYSEIRNSWKSIKNESVDLEGMRNNATLIRNNTTANKDTLRNTGGYNWGDYSGYIEMLRNDGDKSKVRNNGKDEKRVATYGAGVSRIENWGFLGGVGDTNRENNKNSGSEGQWAKGTEKKENMILVYPTDYGSNAEFVEKLTLAHYSNPLHTYRQLPLNYQERVTTLSKHLNATSTRLKRDLKLIGVILDGTTTEIPINIVKYPFYNARTDGISMYSPLRYATNPREIPMKSEGVAFYESKSNIQCDEPSELGSVVPERESDGEWIFDKSQPKGQRLGELGDTISCFKKKFFGSDPLDNPFFKEETIGVPKVLGVRGSTQETVTEDRDLLPDNWFEANEHHPTVIFKKEGGGKMVNKNRIIKLDFQEPSLSSQLAPEVATQGSGEPISGRLLEARYSQKFQNLTGARPPVVKIESVVIKRSTGELEPVREKRIIHKTASTTGKYDVVEVNRPDYVPAWDWLSVRIPKYPSTSTITPHTTKNHRKNVNSSKHRFPVRSNVQENRKPSFNTMRDSPQYEEENWSPIEDQNSNKLPGDSRNIDSFLYVISPSTGKGKWVKLLKIEKSNKFKTKNPSHRVPVSTFSDEGEDNVNEESKYDTEPCRLRKQDKNKYNEPEEHFTDKEDSIDESDEEEAAVVEEEVEGTEDDETTEEDNGYNNSNINNNNNNNNRREGIPDPNNRLYYYVLKDV